MNVSRFAHYELVVSVGSYNHESCLFFRKKEGKTEAIYFNPNYSKKTKGVQFNQVAKMVLKIYGSGLSNARSFTSSCSNLKGICCQLTWARVHNFVINGDSPFDDTTLNLVDYNHFSTPHSYVKYSRRTPNNETDLKLYDI